MDATAAAPPPPTPEQVKALSEALYWGDFTLVAYSCFFTLLCWDIIVTLPTERAKIWKARWSVVKFLYLFNRYFGFFAFLATLCMYNIQVTTETCLKYVRLEPAFLIAVFACYQTILSVRCFALWGRNYFVAGGLAAAILGNIIYQAYVTSKTTAIAIPGYEKFSCIVTGDNKLISGYFLFPWAVDIIITTISFWKIFELTKKTDSPILRVFAREGAIFFAVVFFCNMANGILYLQPYQPVSSIFAGGAAIISSVMTSKLILSLRSTDAFHESHNGDSRHINSHIQNRHLSRGTANLSMPQNNTFPAETDSGEKDVKLDDLESRYLPDVTGGQILVTKQRTVQYEQAV